ncbi:hypothetical protein I552_8246 [Mycobacterium xenopi 3993]|nr:hypothetical protein I552_8246 [Mycobacterium xenopi 3993]
MTPHTAFGQFMDPTTGDPRAVEIGPAPPARLAWAGASKPSTS